MSSSLVVILREPAKVPIESAYLADLSRRGVQFNSADVLANRYPPGLYPTELGLFRRVKRPFPSSRPAQSASSSSSSIEASPTLQVSWSDVNQPLRQEIPRRPAITSLSISPQPQQRQPQAYTIPDAALATHIVTLKPASNDVLSPVHYGHTFVAFFHCLTGDDQYELMTTTLNPSAPLRYDVFPDSGSSDHSWNFSTIAFSSLGGGLLPASLEEVYKARKKIRAPQGVASPELCTTLSYGGGAAPVVEFQMTQTLVHLELELHGPDEERVEVARHFSIGAVTDCNANALSQYRAHDGLLGLGRWKVSWNSTDLGGTNNERFQSQSLVKMLKESGKIQDDMFWIRIAHPLFEKSLRPSYMCFGHHSDPLGDTGGSCAPASPRTKVFLERDDDYDGLWITKLLSITFDSGHGGDPWPKIDVRHTALVDNGSAHTILSEEAVTHINAFTEAFPVENMSPDATVTFTFRDEIRGGEIDVVGQALRFLVNPLGGSGSDTPGTCFAGNDNMDFFVLGLNFFRTFLVGFRDHELMPHVILQRQRDIDPRLAGNNKLR